MILKGEFNCDYETKVMTEGMREFMERMNFKARLIGMDSSTFYNPYGGSAFGWNETTCMDLLRLGLHAWSYPYVMDVMTTKGDVPIHIYGPRERDVLISKDYQKMFDDAYERVHGPGTPDPHIVYGGKGGGWGSGEHKVFAWLAYARVEGKNVLAAVSNVSADRSVGRIYRLNAVMELLDICAAAIRGESTEGMSLKYADYGAAALIPEDGTKTVVLKNRPVDLLYAQGENERFNPASISKVLMAITAMDIIGSNQETYEILDCDICNDSQYWAYVGDIESVECGMYPTLIYSNGSNTLAMARHCGEKILAEKEKWGRKLHAPERKPKGLKDPTSIAFTGDIGFDRYMKGRWKDEKLLDEDIMEFFRSSDHVVANVEGPLIIPPADGKTGQFVHSMDPAAATFLERIGSDIWCIGNNHTMDAGRRGLATTLAVAEAFGAGTVGAGLNEKEASEPVYIDEAGGIGILGVAFMAECVPATETEPGVFRWDNMDYIAERIQEIKARCRWCIIVAHGGEEFTCMPNPYTRDRYIEYLKMGADAVVAHHPHVPNNYETFDDGKMIFYSLGNFIFDTDYQRSHMYTDRAVLVKLLFTEDEMSFEAVGIRISRTDERVVRADLPDIFTDIGAEDYELLIPLAARAHIAEEKRKMVFWKPEIFSGASEEVWHDYFFGTSTDGYAKGAHMDLSLIVPLAEKAHLAQWRACPLEKVKEYILRLI